MRGEKSECLKSQLNLIKMFFIVSLYWNEEWLQCIFHSAALHTFFYEHKQSSQVELSRGARRRNHRRVGERRKNSCN